MQGGCGWLWHCCPLVRTTAAPQVALGSEAGVPRKAVCSNLRIFCFLSSLLPCRNQPKILCFFKLERMDFPDPMHHCFCRFWLLEDSAAGMSEDAAGPASETLALNFGSSKSGMLVCSTKQPNCLCLSMGHCFSPEFESPTPKP